MKDGFMSQPDSGNPPTFDFTPEQLERAEKNLREASSELLETTFVAPDVIYVDLALLKDFILGAIRVILEDRGSSVQVLKDADASILENIIPYMTRVRHNVGQYFPKLNVTTQEVEKCLSDPSKHNAIFLASPVTQFVNTLKANLAINANHAHVSEKFRKKAHGKGRHTREFGMISLYVNTYPLQISKPLYVLLGKFLTDNYGVNVKVFCQNPKDIPSKLFLKYQEIDTAYLKEFLDNPEFQKSLTDRKFMTTPIFATHWFGYMPTQAEPDQAIKAGMVHVAARMGFLSDFKWIEPQHIGPFIPDSVTQEVLKDVGRQQQSEQRHAEPDGSGDQSVRK